MNIERFFNEEVREKKRIGNNIFSRVSTRKGGGNQALRTPYLYMSRKERNKLNGEVRSFNMNEIMKYDEFKEMSIKEQKELLEHWRSVYSTTKIMQESGMSRGIFYKKLHQLGIETDKSRFQPNKRHLTDEEMDMYSNGEFIDFDLFKDIVREQQMELLSKYLEIEPNVRELTRSWKNANEGYLYNIKTKINRAKEAEQVQEQLNDENEQQISMDDEVIDEAIELNKDNKKAVAIEQEPESKPVLRMPRKLRLVRLSKPVQEETPVSEAKNDTHTSDIEIKGNHFSFNLKGQYTADAVIRRIQLALEELQGSEELLNLEIKISNK